MKLAMGQVASTTDKAANLAQITEVVQQAHQAGATVLVLPEFAMYAADKLTAEFVKEAEPLDGPFISELTALAQQHDMTIVAGMHETTTEGDRAFNTVVVVNGEGVQAHYHKQHLYDAFGFKESDYVCPGPLDAPATFEAEGVTFGILTCYDLRFPEAARKLVDEDIDVLLYPASWVPGPRKEDHWKTLTRARAIENTIFVASVSQAPATGTGGSLIVDPMGLVLSELGESNGVGVAEIDPERIHTVRSFNPSLANRRY